MTVGGGYVIYGDTTANLRTLTNLTTGFSLAGTGSGVNSPGIQFNAPVFDARTGTSVSGFGDYNGDGVTDILIGENNINGGGIESGYVIFGDADPTDGGEFRQLHDLEVADLTGGDLNGDGLDDGSVIVGAGATADPLVIRDAGDVDNDGISDFLVGQPSIDLGVGAFGFNEGQAFLVFGSTSGFDGLNPLGGNNGTAVLNFDGATDNQSVGRSVSGIGDINNDGFDDFAIGATGAGGGKGGVYVVFGSSRGSLDTLPALDSLNGANGGFILDMSNSPFGGPQFGFDVNRVGDFNADGFDDFIVGAPGTGEAYLVYGKSGGFTNLDVVNDLTGEGADTSFLANGFMLGFQEEVGFAVTGAGDVNGDGYDDLLIGSPCRNCCRILSGHFRSSKWSTSARTGIS